MVRRFGRHEEDVQARLVGRELGRHFLRRFDDPEVEDFGLVEQVVLVAGALAELCGRVAGIARHDAVDQRAVDAAGRQEPVAETVFEAPVVDILENALFQVLAIFEDEFAREEDEAFGLVALEVGVAVMQQLREFARIGSGRAVREAAGGIEGDARFGGVGDDEADVGLFREGEIRVEIFVGVDAARDDVDQVDAVDRLSSLQALQVEMIQAVLLVEPFDHSLFDGLDHDDGAVKVRFLVGFPDDPFDEGAQEVAFAELDHFFGVGLRLRCCGTVEFVHMMMCINCQIIRLLRF